MTSSDSALVVSVYKQPQSGVVSSANDRTFIVGIFACARFHCMGQSLSAKAQRTANLDESLHLRRDRRIRASLYRTGQWSIRKVWPEVREHIHPRQRPQPLRTVWR